MKQYKYNKNIAKNDFLKFSFFNLHSQYLHDRFVVVEYPVLADCDESAGLVLAQAAVAVAVGLEAELGVTEDVLQR